MRAVIVEALHQAAVESPTIAAVIWLIGANVAPHISLEREQEIIESWLDSLQQRYEDEAIRQWSIATVVPPNAIKVPKFNAAPGSTTKLNIADIQPGFESAVGPTNAQGAAIPDSNPHLPNAHQAWVHQAGPRLANAVATAINTDHASIISDVDGRLASMAETLAGFAKSLSAEIFTAVTTIHESLCISSRRTELLWWREALFSPSLGRSYRAPGPEVRVLALALDLAKLTGPFHPTSVEHFLREAARAAFGVAANDTIPVITLGDFVEHLRNGDADLAVLRGAVGSFPADFPGHGPLLSLIFAASVASNGGEPLIGSIGLPGTVELPFSELAVWLYREALALALSSVTHETPRATGLEPGGKGRRLPAAAAKDAQ